MPCVCWMTTPTHPQHPQHPHARTHAHTRTHAPTHAPTHPHTCTHPHTHTRTHLETFSLCFVFFPSKFLRWEFFPLDDDQGQVLNIQILSQVVGMSSSSSSSSSPCCSLCLHVTAGPVISCTICGKCTGIECCGVFTTDGGEHCCSIECFTEASALPAKHD